MSGKRKNPRPVVGLTGTIGSGKSTAAALFASEKIPVIDADRICAGLFEAGSELLEELRGAFGEQTLLADGSYNRAYIRERIETNPEDHRRLNELTHPAIRRAVDEAIQAASRTEAPFVLYDCPLLFESGEDARCDRTVLVSAPQDRRLRRLMARDGISREAAESRSRIQMSETDKRGRCDFELTNDGDLEQLRSQIQTLTGQLKDEFSDET